MLNVTRRKSDAQTGLHLWWLRLAQSLRGLESCHAAVSGAGSAAVKEGQEKNVGFKEGAADILGL